jgi:glutamate N-acetyltransferase/amino-acid N-acetyltransferase
VSVGGGSRVGTAREESARGAPRAFFSSRWSPAPAHVRELEPAAGLPAGFRAAGVACGIKPSGRPDLGLLLCDAERVLSAARFTRSSTAAAPVLLTRERCDLGALRACATNSGCANAATGERGLDDAAHMQREAARALGVQPRELALASTGGISQFLPMERLLAGIARASGELRADGDRDFQRAIETTDAFEKRACLEVQLTARSVRVCAQCKGAGMISPQLATLLCFVETDASLEPGGADALLDGALPRSFDCVSVDGQLSTNDTVLLISSAASGVHVARGGEDERRLGEALGALLRQLAVLVVADGEGAGRIARVRVRGGERGHMELAARAIANSPLVKAALHGGDPNWGRILQAVGGALPGPQPLPLDIAIEGIAVCASGAAIDHDEDALARAVQATEIEYDVGLPGAGAEAEVIFSDLSHEYVTLNADYTT